MKMKKMIILLFLSVVTITSYSHGGRLNKDGCHHDRKNGGYHCH